MKSDGIPGGNTGNSEVRVREYHSDAKAKAKEFDASMFFAKEEDGGEYSLHAVQEYERFLREDLIKPKEALFTLDVAREGLQRMIDIVIETVDVFSYLGKNLFLVTPQIDRNNSGCTCSVQVLMSTFGTFSCLGEKRRFRSSALTIVVSCWL